MSIKVYSDLKKLADQIKADNSIIEFSKPSKMIKGICFYNIKIRDPDDGVKRDLIVRVKNIPITYGVYKSEDSSNKTDKSLPLMFNIDDMGEYKDFIEAFEDVYFKWTQTADDIKSRKNITVRHIIQREYSDECRDESKRNTKKENPTTRFKLDFSTYSDKYRIVSYRGVKKTLIYDYTTKFVRNKKIYYKEAMIDDVPVDETNADKFVTMGGIIMNGRIHFSSASRGQYGVACSPLAGSLVIKPMDEENIYEGDFEDAEEEKKEEPVVDDEGEVDEKEEKKEITDDSKTNEEEVNDVLESFDGEVEYEE